MPAVACYSLSKGEVMMCLALAGLHRGRAAELAGVSLRTFLRAMRRHRVQAPRSDAKLTLTEVIEIRELLKKHSLRSVAKMKNLHRRTVEEIASYGTWYWVK